MQKKLREKSRTFISKTCKMYENKIINVCENVMKKVIHLGELKT